MTLSSSLLLIIESSFNRYLILDGESLNKFSALSDKVICLHITGLDIHLYFFPNEHYVQLLSQYSGVPDTLISAPLITLINLAKADNAGQFILSSSVTITGDTSAGMQFSNILRQVDIHWEDYFSYLVGDSIAYQSKQLASNTLSSAKNVHHSLFTKLSEYLTEEKHITPTKIEINELIQDIDELRESSDRLNQRIKNIEKLITNN